jgi:hypothetical protein
MQVKQTAGEHVFCNTYQVHFPVEADWTRATARLAREIMSRCRVCWTRGIEREVKVGLCAEKTFCGPPHYVITVTQEEIHICLLEGEMSEAICKKE